jgi:hypothetical protein
MCTVAEYIYIYDTVLDIVLHTALPDGGPDTISAWLALLSSHRDLMGAKYCLSESLKRFWAVKILIRL